MSQRVTSGFLQSCSLARPEAVRSSEEKRLSSPAALLPSRFSYTNAQSSCEMAWNVPAGPIVDATGSVSMYRAITDETTLPGSAPKITPLVCAPTCLAGCCLAPPPPPLAEAGASAAPAPRSDNLTRSRPAGGPLLCTAALPATTLCAVLLPLGALAAAPYTGPG